MPRPRCRRHIEAPPAVSLFKPAGVPARALDEEVMTLDEFEAIRLADFEGLYQDDAAGRMGVSRPTFSRTVESARRKVATALVSGRALRIEGGQVALGSAQVPRCPRCAAGWHDGSPCPDAAREGVAPAAVDEGDRPWRGRRWRRMGRCSG